MSQNIKFMNILKLIKLGRTVLPKEICFFFNQHKGFCLITLFLLILSVATYTILAINNIYHNISEKIFFEFLFYIFSISPLLICQKWFVKLYLSILGAILIFLLSVQAAVGEFYKITADTTFYEVLSVSPPEEIKEFLNTMPLDITVVPILSFLVILMCFIWILWHTRTRSHTTSRNYIAFAATFLPFFSISLVYMLSSEPSKLLKKTIPTRYILGYIEFQKENYALQKLNTDKTSLKNIKIDSKAKKIIGVFVIGESASRSHFSCYGYPRNTTPCLVKRENNLLLFDDIISPAAITPESLKYTFTSARITDKYFQPDYSILSVMKNLDVDTVFVSNQARWNYYNMPVTLLFMSAGEIKYLNEGKDFMPTGQRRKVREKFDESLCQELEKILEKKNDKPLFIFLHMMGSHTEYSNRYPTETAFFARSFRDECNNKLAKTEYAEEVNYYDNTIAYTDTVLDSMMKILDKIDDRPAFLLFFSDHGTVLSDGKSALRSRYCSHPDVYEIPFLVYYTPQYRKLFPSLFEVGKQNIHKSGQLDYLLPAFFSISQISWENFPSQQNIFSHDYIPLMNRHIASGKQAYKKTHRP